MSIYDLDDFEVYGDADHIDLIHSPCRELVAAEDSPADLKALMDEAMNHECPFTNMITQ